MAFEEAIASVEKRWISNQRGKKISLDSRSKDKGPALLFGVGERLVSGKA